MADLDDLFEEIQMGLHDLLFDAMRLCDKQLTEHVLKVSRLHVELSYELFPTDDTSVTPAGLPVYLRRRRELLERLSDQSVALHPEARALRERIEREIERNTKWCRETDKE